MAERVGVILRPAEIPARERGGGASTIPLVSQRVGSKDFLNGITRFGPARRSPNTFTTATRASCC